MIKYLLNNCSYTFCSYLRYILINYILFPIKIIDRSPEMNLNINLSVGSSEATASPDSYTTLNINLQMHQNKIKQHINQMRNQLGKYRLPTVIFDFPESAKDLKLPFQEQFQKSHENQYFEVTKNNHTYKCININEKQIVTNKKKIQKLFTKMTELDNKCYAKLDLFNMGNFSQRIKSKDQFPISIFFENSKLQAIVDLDTDFYNIMEQLLSKIAPKFADSPVMAILPLLGEINFSLDLDSLADLEPDHKEQLFGMMRYEQPDDDEEGKMIQKCLTNTDKIKIYINFDTLGYIQTELEVRMLAFFFLLN